MLLLALVALAFAALPTGLSIRARRYMQAALVFVACAVAPVVVGALTVGLVDPQYADVQGRLLERAAMGALAFIVTAVLFPLFCASVLWELGKFRATPK